VVEEEEEKAEEGDDLESMAAELDAAAAEVKEEQEEVVKAQKASETQAKGKGKEKDKKQTQEFFKQLKQAKKAPAPAPQPEPEPEPEPDPKPQPTSGGVSYSVRRGDTAAVLVLTPDVIRISEQGAVVEEIPFRQLRSWEEAGDTVSFVLSEGRTVALRTAEAPRIARDVASATASAAQRQPSAGYQVWHELAEMYLTVGESGLALNEDGELYREVPFVALRSWVVDEDTITLSTNGAGGELESLSLATRQAAQIASALAAATLALEQKQAQAKEEAAGAAAAQRQEAKVAREEAAQQAEIQMLKRAIEEQQDADRARAAAAEEERAAAAKRARQLEEAAAARGRAASEAAAAQLSELRSEQAQQLAASRTERARQARQLEEEVEAATLATRKEEAAAAAAVQPKLALEPVTAATREPEPDPSLSDRQLILGQAALATLTERLCQMQQQDPSMLGSARFDALCNVIGDYSENPSSSALEAVVKTTVRLAGSFNSDKAFAQQLQRKIFPQIVASEAQQEAATPVRAEHTANLVSTLQEEVQTLRREIMRLSTVIQGSPGGTDAPARRASPEEDRVYARMALAEAEPEPREEVAQQLLESAEELQQPTEESAEATVRALHEQRPAEYKSRNSDRSFAGRLLALQAQLDDGAITEAQYSDEKRRLSQQVAGGPLAPLDATVPRTTVRRHANGQPRIKKDVARSLALACLLRQVSIGELLPIVRSHLGVASISELEELEPADLNSVSLSPLHRRRLLRALDYAKHEAVNAALLQGESMARAGDIQGAIAQCRHALTLGPGLASSPVPPRSLARVPVPAEAAVRHPLLDLRPAGFWVLLT